MSELINNSEERKALLKHMIVQLHQGDSVEIIRKQLVETLKKVPYGEVVEVEQQLLNEGVLTDADILAFCDIHAEAMDGNIDHSQAKVAPAGHPVDTMLKENSALVKVINDLGKMYLQASGVADMSKFLIGLHYQFNQLMDVDKHYRRKENLLFPFLESKDIDGPPKVMWGKHDEIREQLKAAIEILHERKMSTEDLMSTIQLVLMPASKAVKDMVMKEEEILLPMMLDLLTDVEWYDIYKQTPEIGYCLYDPTDKWEPEGVAIVSETKMDDAEVRLPSGSLAPEELLAILNTVPLDMTFVDKDDKVKYFTQGSERIFDRNRAILGRDVRMCHPPHSVHIVEQILEDFKAGKETAAPFWIEMDEEFIHIEYFALRNEGGEYLGTLEVSQNLTEKRALEGDQRLLTYTDKK